MTPPNRQIQDTRHQQETIIITSSPDVQVRKSKAHARICWNTGEEKNCSACYLARGCKARE